MPSKVNKRGVSVLATMLLCGTALSTVATPAAFAQTVATEPTRAAERDTQNIVVTAQRREQNLQDVPLAVSAVSGETLATQGINNPVELRYVAPSINFSNSANTRGEGFQIRGVGTVIFGDGIEQSVGVVVDGVPMGRGGMGTSDLIDVARVEVLRGPQGMLFGKNASAGLISITTNAPVMDETSLALRGSFATQNEIKLNAAGNLALGDKAAFRLAYASTTRDGIIENILRREKLNDRDEQVLRARLLVEPTDKLTINLIADWSERNSLCCAWTARSAPATSGFGALNAASGIFPSPTNLRVAAGAPFFQNINTNGLSATIDYDFSFGTLTSITSWRNWYAFDNNDPDLLPANILDLNTGDSDVTQVSQELRLNSAPNPNFEWTIGALFYRMSNDGGNTQAGTLGVALPPGATLGHTRRSETINESAALFGQAQWTFFDKLTLIAGGRYTDEEVSVTYTGATATGSIAVIPGRFVGRGAGSVKADNFSYRLIGQYRFSPDIMVYASVARGYKGPGIDQNIVAATPTFVKPEIPTSYEAGIRSTLFDGKATFNAALFQTTFKDFQAQVFDQNVFPARFAASNAGELESKGIEAELYVRPVSGLTLLANVAYIESNYTDFKNIACYAAQPILPFGTVRTSPRQCIREFSATGAAVTQGTGNELPNSPKLTYNLAANYTQPIGSLLGTASINYFWRDKVSYLDAGDPGAAQGSYGLLGASVGIGASDDRWRVSLFGKNLTDQKFVDRIIGQPVLGGVGIYSQFVSPEAEQIVGLTLDVKFGG